jgi:hypothetical protein
MAAAGRGSNARFRWNAFDLTEQSERRNPFMVNELCLKGTRSHMNNKP